MKQRFSYDFHIHSCLSPCADNDMTPGNIAGMASLAGLRIVALTDHNTCRNCPGFMQAAERFGLIAVAGMELTTAEDIHMVCLFERLEEALVFDRAVDAQRIRFRNRPDIFGEQLVMDCDDCVTDSESDLLPNATALSLDDAARLCTETGGVCWPAHIDREANGILAVLGSFPESPAFLFAEFRDMECEATLRTAHPALCGVGALFGSDAHRLDGIPDACHAVELEVEDGSPDDVRAALFRFLRGDASQRR